MFGDKEHASLGGAISSPRHLDRRRQAANARVSQLDVIHVTFAFCTRV